MANLGNEAPDFTLKNQDRDDVNLLAFRGSKYVLLHVFPVAFTGG